MKSKYFKKHLQKIKKEFEEIIGVKGRIYFEENNWCTVRGKVITFKVNYDKVYYNNIRNFKCSEFIKFVQSKISNVFDFALPNNSILFFYDSDLSGVIRKEKIDKLLKGLK